MKHIALLTLIGVAPSIAGETLFQPATSKSENKPWLTPTLDMRARYEYADISDNASDPANALTLRTRLGLKTMAWNGFSAVVEGELNNQLIDQYNGGNGTDTSYDAIFDPKTAEINQAYLQYNKFDTAIKVGRQKLILGNAAFVGNVGWRQNEQTYDGVSIVNNSVKDLTLTYTYFNQVNRIFGSDASLSPAARAGEFDSNIHILNASYAGIKGTTLNGYALLMDIDTAGNTAVTGTFGNQTIGVNTTTNLVGLNFYGEYAYQQEGSRTQPSYDSGYAHFSVGKKFGEQVVTLGYELIGSNFATPLCTAHAYNGFADVFVAERLAGGNGLSDLYLTFATPLPFAKIKSATTFHLHGDNNSQTGDYGWEINQVLTKKFTDQITGVVKVAYFDSEKSKYQDTLRLSAQADYVF
jgi:Alginate export